MAALRSSVSLIHGRIASQLVVHASGLRAMSTDAGFSQVQKGPVDRMFELKKRYDQDKTPSKVDLGAGVLRDENGQCHEFDVLHEASEMETSIKAIRVVNNKPGEIDLPEARHKSRRETITSPFHCKSTVGSEAFRTSAARLLFGNDSPQLQQSQIATVQTVAGTGACRIGAVFLNKHWPFTNEKALAGPFSNQASVYLGVPTWPNYEPLFKHAGFPDIRTYEHLDPHYRLNLPGMLEALESAKERSIFVFQGCCHNPTGRDYSQDEWKQIAKGMAAKRHFAFFDTAYQGLGASEDSDAWAARLFAEKGIDMLVAQSFSKNHGLYSERVGALHVVCSDDKIAANVVDQLRALTRWEVSSAPAFGAELVRTILGDPALATGWKAELHAARGRLQTLRKRLHSLLMGLATPVPQGRPGGWDHIIEENGLFSYTSLLPEQVDTLEREHHIYLPGNGRINISGLNESNIERVARAFDVVIRQSVK